jgi:hypothetical protein
VNTLLRSLIVWLLMLALPYQGLAAAAMVAYAPAHGKPVPAPATPKAQHAQQAQHAQYEMGRPPCHETASKVDAAGKGGHTAHGAAATCGNCAACGIGAAALPVSFPALAASPPPVVSILVADNWLPSVHLAQPERPPRPRLA